MRRGVLSLGALLAFGCGPQRPAVIRAAAVAVGAFGASGAASAQTCQAQAWEDCKHALVLNLVVATGLSLSAGAAAFLEATSDPRRAPAGGTPASSGAP